jgi:hypothetical protein
MPIKTALVLVIFLGGTSASLAQTNPAESNTAQMHKIYRGGRVSGPAYGHPGEPLGPAYMGTTGPEQMSDPRTCGPGACQDNPRY